MNMGWIKLHRTLLEDAVCRKSVYFHVWVVLLLSAAHTEQQFIFNNHPQTLLPGQLITGRKMLSQLTGIPEMTIEYILKFLTKAGKIQQQKTSKFRIITITKWPVYQNPEILQQHTVRTLPAKQQHTDTYKNINNEKNGKKGNPPSFISFEQQELAAIRARNEAALQAFVDAPED